MSIIILDASKKQAYLNRINNTNTHFDKMIAAIDQKLFEYGKVEYGLVNETIHPNFAATKREALQAELKNLNMVHLENTVADLLKIKEDYLDAVIPSTKSISDPLELALVEKELKVMKDTELREYYKDNFKDETLARLITIEYKNRVSYKSAIAYMPLQGLDYSDAITVEIDDRVRVVKSMRDMSNSICTFPSSIGDNGNPIPKMLPWDTVFQQVKKRNMGTVPVSVSLIDFASPYFIK